MKKSNQKSFCIAAAFLAAFAAWTAAVRFVDVQPIGPQGSSVGLAMVNRFIHGLTGVHLSLYTLTDWLSLIPLGIIIVFALLGLMQWIRRKSLFQVDRSLFVLGGVYLVVLAVYVLFELFVVNYRPVLIDGVLEASYPSSTTMLVLCVMPTAILQCSERIHNRALQRCLAWSMIGFTVFMAAARFVSGVHWFTDISGGVLLSAGLVALYDAVRRVE